MAINSKFNSKANDDNAVRNAGMVVVYGQTGSAVTAAYNKDLTGRIDTVISNGRVKDAAGGAQDGFSDRLQKANASISYFSRYDGDHQLITTITDTVAGLSKNFIKFAGTQRFRSILYRETRRTQQTNGLTLNAETGDWTTEPTVVLDEFKMLGGSLSDDAARPTRAIPGEFVIIIADSTNPELKDYEPRTG